MSYIFIHPTTGAARGQRGFTLVELMVSITISVFLLGGLLTVVQQTRNTYTAQTALAQLQDNERLAMTLMTDVIQSAGYFPSPQLYDAVTTMPASSAFPSAGFPTLKGEQDVNAQGDTITARYAAGQPDSVFNCRGEANTVAPYDGWENKFSVDDKNNLVCDFTSTTNGAAARALLVNGVQSMTVWYGVNTKSSTATCADSYLRANAMSADNWNNVCSVKVQLVFIVPGGGNQTVTFRRIIGVMNKVGVTT
jgi:type IV pilus assembly protein PilW